MNNKYITVQELSEIIKLAPYTIRKHAREGLMPCYRVGRKILFDIAEIEIFIRKNPLHSDPISATIPSTQSDISFPRS
jgi:excisionase family DNA binding protein